MQQARLYVASIIASMPLENFNQEGD